jgi:hypothetical protein
MHSFFPQQIRSGWNENASGFDADSIQAQQILSAA